MNRIDYCLIAGDGGSKKIDSHYLELIITSFYVKLYFPPDRNCTFVYVCFNIGCFNINLS